ncbi:hypothetical protein CERSUDRAFT_49068 [Gelatoporia subvermispora B]|uniref:Uncharacterized protein n=1 Tax=Ceriporiopsis subvermispora (strain B) TaxID=914234 RepID=M2R247_CERS8|nr:hypothetical protein CERSUDRAFT_49068 [Gelatoporia subvermispora B]
MPWPDKVLRQFQAVPPNPLQSDFHGPYNKLLNTLFPPDTDFTVVPQYLQPVSSRVSDFIVSFEVFLQNRPVFILELKPPTHLTFISTRHAADRQIRERLSDLAGQCPIPMLHAVSAMGTRLCFYSLDTTDPNANILPLAIQRHPTRVSDTAPAERWDCDVLDAQGEARLLAVVEEIKQACAQLIA